MRTLAENGATDHHPCLPQDHRKRSSGASRPHVHLTLHAGYLHTVSHHPNLNLTTCQCLLAQHTSCLRSSTTRSWPASTPHDIYTNFVLRNVLNFSSFKFVREMFLLSVCNCFMIKKYILYIYYKLESNPSTWNKLQKYEDHPESKFQLHSEMV